MASDGRTPRDRRGAIEPPAGETPPESHQDIGTPPESTGSAGPEEAAPVAAAAEAAPIEPAPETPPPVAEPSAPEPPPAPVRERAPRRRLFWPMLGSAVLGAILALAALAFMYRFNVLEPYKIDIGGKLLSARLTALEARVRDSRPSPAPAAPVPLAAAPGRASRLAPHAPGHCFAAWAGRPERWRGRPGSCLPGSTLPQPGIVRRPAIVA